MTAAPEPLRLLGAVLAGGRSRRYGADKSGARVAGVPMVQRVLDAARVVCGDDVVVVSPRPVAGAETTDRIPDRVADRGPLGGLHAALHEARRRELDGVLLLACDLPLLDGSLLRSLVEAAARAPEVGALAPRGDSGPPEVACAVYRATALPEVEARLDGSDRSLQGLFQALDGRTPGLASRAAFLNVNTPQDRARAQAELARADLAESQAAASAPEDLPPILCVVGKKKSGKTTTVVGLVSELTGRGLRVMTLKHGHHFRLDREGTDSWRHRHEGGAARVVLAGPDEVAVTGEWSTMPEPGAPGAMKGPPAEPPLEEVVRRYLADADVVVAEGYKHAARVRVEVFRAQVHPEPLYREMEPAPAPHLHLAILAEGGRADGPPEVPVLDVDDPDRFRRLADLVEERWPQLARVGSRRAPAEG